MIQRKVPLRLLSVWLGASLVGGNKMHNYRSRVILATIPNYNRTTISGSKKPSRVTEKPKCVNGVCEYNPRPKDSTDIRGGAFNPLGDDYDDGYDDYDEYDDEEEMPPQPRRPPPSRKRPPHDPVRRRGPPQSRPSARRYRKSSGGGPLGTAASLAKKTVDMTTNAAAASIKTSGKAALYLVSPKYVQRNEVWGVWRLDQQVGKLPDGPFVSCAANVELTPPGDCITKYKEEVYHTPYMFKEKSWPKSCVIEFEARAFQGPSDETPVLMLYKGYFRRKLADRNVIKVVGKIYELRKQRFGRGTKKVQVGSFVARRRITAPPGGVRLQEKRDRASRGNRKEEYDDEGYDDEGEYDEYDEYDNDEEEDYE